MNNLNARTIDFGAVAASVKKITDTKSTIQVTAINHEFIDFINNVDKFSDYGLSTLGKTVGFPAPFVRELSKSDADLANEVIRNRVQNYFDKGRPEFYARCFFDKTCGVVSHKYSYFDDNQVVDILEGSPLAKMGFQNAIITPERFHLRAIDKSNPFKVSDDSSPLYFAYFIDNSMVGQSSFKVQLGVYRLACTNGMILPVQEFVICRQVHRGNRDIAAEFNESIAFLSQKQDALKELVMGMSGQEATIEGLKEEFRKEYLAKKLNLNRKETDKVMELYQTVYDGHTKWGMANAITEFARDLNDINRREFLERAAFKVA